MTENNQKQLGRDYPEILEDDNRTPLSIWYEENEEDISAVAANPPLYGFSGVLVILRSLYDSIRKDLVTFSTRFSLTTMISFLGG